MLRRAEIIAAAALALATGLASRPAAAQPTAGDEAADDDAAAADPSGDAATPSSAVAAYFRELERAGFIDATTGSKDTLHRELDAAERLLAGGAAVEAAVALFAIVESPRYQDFTDFVEYQNAEYDLGVALAGAGALDSAVDYLERVLGRGPSALYWAPAHRRAIDIALETRDYSGMLARLIASDRAAGGEPIPVGASGERAYLEARVAYDQRNLDAAEVELTKISRKSRLYASALYMRGVIRARRGELRDAAQAMCEIVDTPDDDVFTFVVDDRYFTIKDLARLGLGRLAHEQGEYDDAYYHYFQVPDDSDRLPEALFESSWSMYQKRELATARDLAAELLREFPDSPFTPEASLLAGFVELADCKFDEAQAFYDRLVADLQPVVDEMDRIRKDPDRRAALFSRALAKWRAEKAEDGKRLPFASKNLTDRVLALLRLDPEFVRLHDAVAGMRRAAAAAPLVARAWSGLARRVARTHVGAVSGEQSIEEEDAADANGLLEDVRRLRAEILHAKQELRRGVRDQTLPADAADAEAKRLSGLADQADELERRVAQAAADADGALVGTTAPALAPMIRADLDDARGLDKKTRALQARLEAAADALAVRTIERLYLDTRKVLDKAKLGKIDAVIGQKRTFDIKVQDLASGRSPEELYGRLWEQGLIGDDEEYWPFEGEYWKDEYEGYR